MNELLEMIAEPSGEICRKILEDNQELLKTSPGSAHNHQNWKGGYWDHVVEVMNFWVLLYGTLEATGRIQQLPEEECFSLSDGLLILFLHDLEKPWRYRLENDSPIQDANGEFVIDEELKSKAARSNFVQNRLKEYGLELTPNQKNGLKYVEGVRDGDYRSNDRVMKPLATLCHCCDLLSARGFYAFPLAENDPWALGRIVIK
jgi:hypothetical protein